MLLLLLLLLALLLSLFDYGYSDCSCWLRFFPSDFSLLRFEARTKSQTVLVH